MPCGGFRRRREVLSVRSRGSKRDVQSDDDAAMMILRSAPPSPFGRKVRIALSLLGFDNDVRIEPADTSDPQRQPARAKSARQDSGADHRGRHCVLRFAGDPRLSRPPRRRRQDHPARAGAAPRGAALAGLVRRHPRCVDPDRLREPLAQGGEARAEMARSSGRQSRRARSLCWKPRRRRSGRNRPSRMSGISRSPARLVIAICALAALGAAIIRASSPGSTISPRACRPLPKRRQRCEFASELQTKSPGASAPGLFASWALLRRPRIRTGN